MKWGYIPDSSEKTSTLSSTGCRGCTSPPKMHTVWSMTDKTCDERRSLSVSNKRVHMPLSVLIGIAALIGIVTVISNQVVGAAEKCVSDDGSSNSTGIKSYASRCGHRLMHDETVNVQVRTCSEASVASGRSQAPSPKVHQQTRLVHSATSRDSTRPTCVSGSQSSGTTFLLRTSSGTCQRRTARRRIPSPAFSKMSTT
jgi:hypothetical protein